MDCRLIARKGQSWKGYHHLFVRLFNRNVVSKKKSPDTLICGLLRGVNSEEIPISPIATGESR